MVSKHKNILLEERPLTNSPEAFAAYYGMEYGKLPLNIPQEILDLLPAKIALHYQALPLQMRDTHLVIAIADPSNLPILDSVRVCVEKDIEFVCVDSDQLNQALLQYYGNTEDINSTQTKVNKQEIHLEKQDAPIIKMVFGLLLQAYESAASDIHLEPMEQGFRVRFRIDGVLQEIQTLPTLLQTSLINRLKIMSGSISIAEKRLPQDGRFCLQLKNKSIDFRISIIPTLHGESAVIRILDKSSLVLGLAELGLLNENQTQFENLIQSANGMILITGPTGSGKTTTLYACLNSLNKSDIKLITIEDPIEYQIPGINQIQVNLETGMTFPVALRSILRQAPNILMIGEIRDYETASIAIHASLTGHLILSTLHTNDAPSAITRLIDIGISPFLIASSLRGIIAQRLVRRLCPHCKKPSKLSQYECKLLNIEPHRSGQPMAAVGCKTCHGKGYKGRIGIFEIFVLDEAIYQQINQSTSPLQLCLYARNAGMRNLSEDGVGKIFAGLTTAQEVIATTLSDTSYEFQTSD